MTSSQFTTTREEFLYGKPWAIRLFRQQSAQECRNRDQGQSRIGHLVGFDRLAGADSSRSPYSSIEGKSSVRSGTTLPRASGRDYAHGGSQHHLSPSRGSNRTLCAGEIFVRADGFKLATRSRHDFRVHANDGSRRHGHLEQKRSPAGAVTRASRSESFDERHDSAGSDDSVSERSGLNEALCGTCDNKLKKSWWQVRIHQGEGQRDLEQGQGSGPKGASLCQDDRRKKRSEKSSITQFRIYRRCSRR